MRTDPINCISDFTHFVERWDDEGAAHTVHDQFLEDRNGRINTGGASVYDAAQLLTKWDAGFNDCIETGVRELVLFFVWECNALTYSSCGGHRSQEFHSFQPRHIRFAMRSLDEWISMNRMLEAFLADSRQQLRNESVECVFQQSSLLCQKVGEVPSLDLLFLPKDVEAAYWSDIDKYYENSLRIWRERHRTLVVSEE